MVLERRSSLGWGHAKGTKTALVLLRRRLLGQAVCDTVVRDAGGGGGGFSESTTPCKNSALPAQLSGALLLHLLFAADLCDPTKFHEDNHPSPPSPPELLVVCVLVLAVRCRRVELERSKWPAAAAAAAAVTPLRLLLPLV